MTITESDHRCFACGAHWEPGDRFCAECGSSLAGAQLAAALDARDGGAAELLPVPAAPLHPAVIPLAEDVDAPLLGPNFFDRLARAGVDPASVWTWDLGLGTRAVNGLVAVDAFVLSDIAHVSVERLLRTPGVGATTLAELRTKTALSDEDGHELATRVRDRRDTVVDPSARVFGPDFAPTLATLDVDPRQIALRALPLRSSYRSVLASRRLATLDDVAWLTNLELLRLLRAPRTDLLDELWSAGRAWLDSTAAPTDSALLAAFEETDGLGLLPTTQPTDEDVTAAFDRLVAAVASLPERTTWILTQRFGLDGDRRQSLQEIGRSLGVTRARAHQIAAQAVRVLIGRRGTFSAAYNGVESLHQELGLPWRDEALSEALAKLYPRAAWANAGHLHLLLEIFPGRTRTDRGIDGVNAAAVAVIGRTGPLPLADLAVAVMALLDPADVERFPSFSITRRLELAGPVARRNDGRYDLPSDAVAGVNDKRVRRLNAMIGVVERLGPSHFTTIARELDDSLPTAYRLSEHNVHAWLERYDSVFVWTGPGRYGLASQDVGIRVGSDGSEAALPDAYRGRRRKGIGDEIATLLLERGPVPLDDVADHILSRFQVNRTSVLAAVQQDSARRFVLTEDRSVAFRPPDEGPAP